VVEAAFGRPVIAPRSVVVASNGLMRLSPFARRRTTRARLQPCGLCGWMGRYRGRARGSMKVRTSCGPLSFFGVVVNDASPIPMIEHPVELAERSSLVHMPILPRRRYRRRIVVGVPHGVTLVGSLRRPVTFVTVSRRVSRAIP